VSVTFPSLKLAVAVEKFPIAGTFTISRGSRTEAVVVTATISDGRHMGRGECVPYPRYGETVDGIALDIAAQAMRLKQGGTHGGLLAGLKAGAARNALDCAFWDLAAKQQMRRIWDIAGMPEPQPFMTCYTLSLGTPEGMEEAARANSHRPLLKVKRGGDGDTARIAAVRRGAPAARLVVDANEAWNVDNFAVNAVACVELIEQPLPGGNDNALFGLACVHRAHV
jgi:L-Ala-D/L-Glu epimerase